MPGFFWRELLFLFFEHVLAYAAERADQSAEDAAGSATEAAGSATDAAGSATAAAASAQDSEAWAVGQRGGVDVPASDETYENNSKYYAGVTEEKKTAILAAYQEVIAFKNIIELLFETISPRVFLIFSFGYIQITFLTINYGYCL